MTLITMPLKTISNQGSYMLNDIGFYSTNISTLFMDALYKHQGFSFIAAYANRNAAAALARNSDSPLNGDAVKVGAGLNLKIEYLVSKTIAVSARYTSVTLDRNCTEKPAKNQYTLGVSKYIAGHKLEVQTDVSNTNISFKTNQLLHRLQVGIHFL
jgi:phosphate-selective porin OprO/OprP